MNLPNQLTVLRIVLSPVFLLVLLLPLEHSYFWAAAVFAIASITDFLDGHLARKYKQVTTFGKLTDPVADKLLTTAALLAFFHFGWCDVWLVLLVLAREFLVTSVRMVAGAQGAVISASIWGKVKTVSQMVSILLILFLAESVQSLGFPAWLGEGTRFVWFSETLLWITAILAAISGAGYVFNAAKRIDFNTK